MFIPLVDEKWRTTTCWTAICQAAAEAENQHLDRITRDLHSGGVRIEHEEEKARGFKAALVPAKAGTQAGFPLARQ
jgi:hypothetical protein